MRFRRGLYALLVSQACFPRLGIVLEELQVNETPATKFTKSLQYLRAEISRGADVADLEPLGESAGDFVTTLHGYRVHIQVNEVHFTVTLVDIDDS
ncbi:hypothetical protein AB2M62_12585 [Sphingomonas sp. MMS12-HWE2-04]|uniref:hypothetical protein n=1 Tax=Sphingomonas sp. MMS12-HWE2-04 TaxID=3234199 RepID=UPI00384C5531